MSRDYSPRIYVACLASYNNGVLHGAWIDADQDADTIQAEIAAMLRQSRFPNVLVDCPDCEGEGGECETCKGKGKVPSAEEYAIHDYDDFGKVKIGEYESIETVAAIAEALSEHGEVFAVAYDYHNDIGAALEDVDDYYHGHYSNAEAWAEEYWNESGMMERVPEELRGYIDLERWASDMLIDTFRSEEASDGGVYIFSRH